MPGFHPLADAFPLMEDGSVEFEELVQDIKDNGLTDPVVLHDGLILDGRNRYRACQILGIAHREIRFDDLKLGSDDPATYVWSKNAVRRQLTPGQRDMAAQTLESLGWGGQRTTSDGALTRKEIAEKTGGTVKGMERAARVRRDAVPEVVTAVEKGKIPLHTADRLSRLPEEDQTDVMKEPVKEIPAAVSRKEARKAPDPAVQMHSNMTGSKAGIRDVQMIGKFWEEHRDQILTLKPEELRVFVKDLEESRAATARLLHVIEEEILPEWTLPGKKPGLLSTALNKLDSAKKPAAETEKSVSGTLSPEAAKTLERTAPAAKAPAKPRVRKTAAKKPVPEAKFVSPSAADAEKGKGSV